MSCAHVGAATSFGGVSVVVGGFDLSATNDSVFGLIDCYPNDVRPSFHVGHFQYPGCVSNMLAKVLTGRAHLLKQSTGR